MKTWNNMKLKDFKEDRYLLLVEENYPYHYFVQPFDKELQKVQIIQPYETYQGLLIIDNLPKEYFTRLVVKVDGKEYSGADEFERQRLTLIELNRAIDLFLKVGFIPDFNIKKIKYLIYDRIEKTSKNIDTWINNFGRNGMSCNIDQFNSLIVDMYHKYDKFNLKKDNVVISILNDYENSFILFKREILEDKEIRYNGKSIFHHKLLV